ncbi:MULTISPECIES: PepSY-associated TM helix domain-containing protein [Methylosinus]|uniref:PepSY domain-containing protein n=1 Tax=Methylosinus trichosporium (strain ATCC 35070 / NCIMB 11131 / UNIQEM 75 / OB3b) TaxID=595536 RepID=A0A2D2D6Q0_METT3|nr:MULTISPECIES: PepSY-associated TM helix domain-containing protein [Methylosinus]ATQ70635.1 PepSY domain-containing protein [Methylosinus trichosporium OB3b]OBS50743.1 hypothetical protein A8B73_19950 [Methylosinus sp. 3S-1]
MTPKTLRFWSGTHKWTSLICTLFLLVICLTGLPLIFHEEIGDWLSDDPPYAVLPADAPRANLDTLVDAALARYRGEIVRSMFIDDDEPKVVVTLAPSMDAEPRENHWLRFDARTGELLKDGIATRDQLTFMRVMLRLHVDLFADLPGGLFLGFMGLLFVVALVSGVVLYAPFMSKLEFGALRWRRNSRILWLDMHNLLGVATLAWALAIGATGVVNELSRPLFLLWQATDVAAILAPYQGTAPPVRLSPVQAAFDTVREAVPNRTLTSIIFPTTRLGSPHHYVIWTKGDTPLTSRLFQPAMIDAATGELTLVAELPWYLKALEVSRPLHFGDYAGMPLKIIWAILDVATIFVIGGGLYLWAARRRTPVSSRLAEAQPDALDTRSEAAE